MIDLATQEAISNVGFPIVAFLLMFYQSSNTIKKNTEMLKKLCDNMERLKDAIKR